jgi:hypothetical protein
MPRQRANGGRRGVADTGLFACPLDLGDNGLEVVTVVGKLLVSGKPEGVYVVASGNSSQNYILGLTYAIQFWTFVHISFSFL